MSNCVDCVCGVPSQLELIFGDTSYIPCWPTTNPVLTIFWTLVLCCFQASFAHPGWCRSYWAYDSHFWSFSLIAFSIFSMAPCCAGQSHGLRGLRNELSELTEVSKVLELFLQRSAARAWPKWNRFWGRTWWWMMKDHSSYLIFLGPLYIIDHCILPSDPVWFSWDFPLESWGIFRECTRFSVSPTSVGRTQSWRGQDTSQAQIALGDHNFTCIMRC